MSSSLFSENPAINVEYQNLVRCLQEQRGEQKEINDAALVQALTQLKSNLQSQIQQIDTITQQRVVSNLPLQASSFIPSTYQVMPSEGSDINANISKLINLRILDYLDKMTTQGKYEKRNEVQYQNINDINQLLGTLRSLGPTKTEKKTKKKAQQPEKKAVVEEEVPQTTTRLTAEDFGITSSSRGPISKSNLFKLAMM